MVLIKRIRKKKEWHSELNFVAISLLPLLYIHHSKTLGHSPSEFFIYLSDFEIIQRHTLIY